MYVFECGRTHDKGFIANFLLKPKTKIFLPEHDYVTFGYAIANTSACCLSSVTFAHPTHRVQIVGSVYILFCTLAIRWTPCKILRRSSHGTPPSGFARGIAKYTDVGHVEGYISETVQDTSSDTITAWQEIIPVESNGTTLDLLGWPLIRILGPQFRETVYISEVNGARKVKSDAQVAMNKNLDPV